MGRYEDITEIKELKDAKLVNKYLNGLGPDGRKWKMYKAPKKYWNDKNDKHETHYFITPRKQKQKAQEE